MANNAEVVEDFLPKEDIIVIGNDVGTSSLSSPSSPSSSLWWTLWTAYNAEDSGLPFGISMLFWTSIWIYYRWLTQRDFARFYAIHTFHHIAAIVLACCSLHYQDNSIFHERIGIFFSMPYFIIDILDCLHQGHFLYIFHGAICLGLGLCNYRVPLLMQLRMNSKAVFIETSSILLYQVKQYRHPVLFGIFALTYTLCRIVWIPFMGKELLDHGMEWKDPIFLALIIFYGLQVHWWIKILQILINGGESKKKETSSSTTANSTIAESTGDDDPAKNKAE